MIGEAQYNIEAYERKGNLALFCLHSMLGQRLCLLLRTIKNYVAYYCQKSIIMSD